MAFFNIRQWLDRISEHPNRRTLTNVEDPTDVKTYDLSRAEGEVSVQGTALTGANLTDLENRIGAAFTAVENAMPEANPAETSTASLTKLKVDGTVYEVEGGGGGTTIEKITKAEWDAMTAEERAEFIGVVEDTNADYVPLTAENIPYDSENSIAEKVAGVEDDVEANTQAIAGALKIANVNSLKSSTEITSSTAYSYTGVRVNIPANSIYCFMATSVYITNSPTRCTITTSSTSGGSLPNADSSSGGHKTAVVSGYASSAVSLYVWAQYSGAGANRIDTDGFYIKLE